MKLTFEEYKEYINNIDNSEVDKIIFSVLEKINIKLYFIKHEELEEVDILKINFFRIFFKQYNTILVLLDKTKYKYNLECEYLDIKSIYLLIRSIHELYLTFQYIFNSNYFDLSSEEEINFKYLIYKYCGGKDNIKTFYNHKRVIELSDEKKKALLIFEKESKDLFNLIRNNKIYKNLPNNIKLNIKNGRNWKISKIRELSWADLLDNSSMSKEYGKDFYASLSQYAHTSFNSILLELNHNGDKEGMLYHLCLLSSLIIKEFLNIEFNGEIIEIIDEDLISKRELSLIVEFIGMSIRGLSVSVPPKQ